MFTRNSKLKTQNSTLIVLVYLIVLSFAGHARSAQASFEPNYAPASDVNDVNKPVSVVAISVADVNKPEFNNGLTLSAFFQDGTIEDAPDGWGRIGYQYGSLEPFIGLDFSADSFEIGFKLYSRNAVTDVKYFSDLLETYFNSETMEIRGYSGAHRVIAKDKEDTYTGAILGIEQKEKGSPLSLTAEAQFNDDNRIFYYVGLKWGF